MLEKEEIEAFKERVIDIRENKMGTRVQLGPHPEFKAIQEELKPHGYKACSVTNCRHPVQPFSGFSKNGDKLQSRCKTCANNPAASAAAKQATHNSNAAVAATVPKVSQIEVESEAINNCLMPLHEEAGIKCLINYEFRRADTIARRDSWMAAPGVYLAEQVKADGLYKEDKDGVRPRKPNNSKSRDGGGVAKFSHCMGYSTMAMIFVKSRFVDATGDEIVRKLWVVDGALVTNETLHENADGTLGPQRFAPLPTGSAAEFGAAIDALVLGEAAKPLVSLETLYRDVQAPLQRKEMFFMYACKAIYTIAFEAGNQTVVDCLVNCVSTQAKVHNLVSGKADMKHWVNGIPHQKYSEHDLIDQFLIGCVVKSGDRFYLMHALLSREELMYNNVLIHNGHRGRPPSGGSGSVYLTGGIYEKWLTKHKNGSAGWLGNPKNKWRAPVELFPDDPATGLSLENLEEVAQEANDPSAFPSQALIDNATVKLNQSLATAAEAAAKRVAEDADRAEAAAAKASEAGPSTVINNIDNSTHITNNYHIHTDEPAAKRLRQSTLTELLR